MRLSDLKPCASCGGPLRGKENKYGTWYVITVSQAMLNPRVTNEVLGLTRFFHGALQLAELFCPSSNDAAMVFGDHEPALLTRLSICFECCLERPLGLILEAIRERERDQEEQTAPAIQVGESR